MLFIYKMLGILFSPIVISPQCRISASVSWVSIGSGNGLLPIQRQAITWTSADLLSIGLLGTNFSEIWIAIEHFSFIKLCLKMLSTKWRPFCPGGDELKKEQPWSPYVPPVPRWKCSKHECQVAPQSQLVSGSHDFRSHDFRSHDFLTAVAPLKLCGFLVITGFFSEYLWT